MGLQPVAEMQPQSIAGSLFLRAHSLAQRASDTASNLNNKLAPYSFPEPKDSIEKDKPVESLPDYFHGLRCALDNIENAINQIASSTARAQL